MSGREMTYAILGIVGATSVFFILKHFGAGNSVGDMVTLPLSTPITTTLLIDLMATFVLILVWLFSEKQSVSGGAFWLCIAVTALVAISTGFALFVLLRERQLRLAQERGRSVS